MRWEKSSGGRERREGAEEEAAAAEGLPGRERRSSPSPMVSGDNDERADEKVSVLSHCRAMRGDQDMPICPTRYGDQAFGDLPRRDNQRKEIVAPCGGMASPDQDPKSLDTTK
jgi:hypothetical protein